MAVQMSLSVLVLQCFTRNNSIWLWIAIGWHTVLDFGVAGLQYWTKALGHFGLLLTEGYVLLAALASLWIIYYFRRKPAVPAPEALAPAPGG